MGWPFIENPAHYQNGLRKSIISEEDRQLASHIFVSALKDHALRVVRTVIGYLRAMMECLDACYDPKSMSNKVSKMSELVSIWCTSIRDDMSKHIDRLAGFIKQLLEMKTEFADSMTI